MCEGCFSGTVRSFLGPAVIDRAAASSTCVCVQPHSCGVSETTAAYYLMWVAAGILWKDQDDKVKMLVYDDVEV